MSLSDTSPEAARVLMEAYRKMQPGKKWLLLGETYQDARILHAAGMRFRQPNATESEIQEAWLAIHLGPNHPKPHRETTLNEPVPNLRGLREVVAIFTALGIPYALGGSMASSLYGIARYTRDGDLTVEPFPGKEAQLAAAFGPDYYLSLPAIQDAIRQRASFNIINTSTGFKVDAFVCKDQPYERSAMSRRVAFVLPEEPKQPIFVHSPEDVVLFKLRWYRLGNQISQQQWSDVLGILQIQREKLDDAYLDHWAKELDVADLLARARQEAAL
jgi:hypothetical protein